MFVLILAEKYAKYRQMQTVGFR